MSEPDPAQGQPLPADAAGTGGSAARTPGRAPPRAGRPAGAPTTPANAAGTEAQNEPPGSTVTTPTVVGPNAGVVINEVGCRNAEFVELINHGSSDADLTHFALADRSQSSVAVRLSGTLAPGARASFPLSGLACDEEAAVLFEDGAAIDQVRPPLMPATASFARLPDGRGPFALATPTRNQPNRVFVDEASRLFRELTDPLPAALPELRITLPRAEYDSLRGVTSESPRPWLEATLTFRDARGQVGPTSTGIHLKGRSVFRDIDGKSAFRLDFDRFEAGNSLFGLEHITLNNFVQDPSASHERVYYGLLARWGRAAPRVGYVKVWVNDEPFGVYLAMESIDEHAFLGRSFSSTSLMYEGTYGMDLYTVYVNEFDEDFGTDPGRRTLAHVVDVLSDVEDSTLLDDTESVVDWRQVTSQMAADLVAGHYDSYTANRNNFSFHFDDSSRLAVVSSGADQTFEQNAERDPKNSRLLELCLANAACTRMLDDAFAQMTSDLQRFLASGGGDGLRADAVRLTRAFEDDPRIEWNPPEIEEHVAAMLTYIERTANGR